MEPTLSHVLTDEQQKAIENCIETLRTQPDIFGEDPEDEQFRIIYLSPKIKDYTNDTSVLVDICSVSLNDSQAVYRRANASNTEHLLKVNDQKGMDGGSAPSLWKGMKEVLNHKEYRLPEEGVPKKKRRARLK